MQCRPFADEPQRSVWQRAGEHFERLDRDRRVLPYIQGVKMRYSVFRVVHRDDDSVELADARHPRNRGAGAGCTATVRVNHFGLAGKHQVMEERELADAAVFERSVAQPQLFSIVFDRYYRAVYGYLTRRVGRTIADDLAAETFIRAFERRAAFDRNAERALPWLLGIALNLLAHHRRSEARQFRALSRAVAPTGDAGEPDADTTLRLVAGLEQLDDYDREALLLYAWGELKYHEIAEVLGIPVGTVRSRIHRARTKLRQALEPSETENVVRLRREGAHGA